MSGYLLKYFIPIRSSGIGTRFETSDQIPFGLKSNQIYGMIIFLICVMFHFYFIFITIELGYSFITFLCNRSRASWSPTAFISVFWRADVMYMCISRNLSIDPPCSACSISNCDSRFTNHSKLLWSRLIQKKSTWI